jgi:hypothetical protein
MTDSGMLTVDFDAPRFVVLDGHRLRFVSLSMAVEFQEFEQPFEVDLARGQYAYENAVTGEVQFVPIDGR